MQNNKELYTFLLDHSSSMTEKWIKTFNDDDDLFFSTAYPKRLSKIRFQSQLFFSHLSKVFLVEKGLFFSSFDEWSTKLSEKLLNKEVPLPEVLTQLKQLRMIYWETIGEYVHIRSKKISHKEIMLWSDLLYIAFDEILEAVSNSYAQAEKRKRKQQQKQLRQSCMPIVAIAEGLAMLAIPRDAETNLLKEMMRQTLTYCSEKYVRHLFIDLSSADQHNHETEELLNSLISSLRVLGIGYSISGVTSIDISKDQLVNRHMYQQLLTALQAYTSEVRS
jgi:rsbT co-antagonist protein RsbR